MSKVREFWITKYPNSDDLRAFDRPCHEDIKHLIEKEYHVIEKHHANQLAEALERITNYPKYYASSLSNGFLDSSKTMEGQFEIVKNIAKQALKNYQEGE